MIKKLEVIHFQRKQRGEGNFSLEFIFEDVRNKLRDRVDFKVVYAKYFSNGIVKRFMNVIDAVKFQGEINHVTGDILYLNILFDKNRTILTVLDCGFMNTDRKLLRAFYRTFWLKLPEKKAKYITAISQATKDDIIKYTGCNPNKIVVIPVAVSEHFKPSPKEFNKEYPVLLQVGTARNKNILRLSEALEGIKCRLVIIGRVNEELKSQLQSNKIDYVSKINISPEDMYNEYVNCDIVTFISTLEGFGMPIVEGNCVERVVITGNNTSMPEVAGNAASFVDPFSAEDMRKGILRIIEDDQYREQLIENGKINRQRFRSDVIANMYYDLYKKIYTESQSIPMKKSKS